MVGVRLVCRWNTTKWQVSTKQRGDVVEATSWRWDVATSLVVFFSTLFVVSTLSAVSSTPTSAVLRHIPLEDVGCLSYCSGCRGLRGQVRFYVGVRVSELCHRNWRFMYFLPYCLPVSIGPRSRNAQLRCFSNRNKEEVHSVVYAAFVY